MPTPIGRDVIEGVRRFRGYREELQKALLAHYPDAVVGKRPYLSWDGCNFEIAVYSDKAVEDTFHAHGLPEVRAIVERARNCGPRLGMMIQSREALNYLPNREWAVD